jgi:RNA polymerase sporulation-specific sigma factor
MSTRTPPDTTHPGTAAPCPRDDALIEAAQGGDQLAFERLLRRHQSLLYAQASRFYLPGGDQDDAAQEARIGFMKAVRFYRGRRGSSFRTFAELCVARQLAGAVAAARRSKHEPLNGAARGDPAERTLAAVPDRDEPVDLIVARDRLGDLVRQAGEFSELERNTLGHVLAGWSSGEAARRLGLPRRSTDNALQRAKRKLRGWHERWAARVPLAGTREYVTRPEGVGSQRR